MIMSTEVGSYMYGGRGRGCIGFKLGRRREKHGPKVMIEEKFRDGFDVDLVGFAPEEMETRVFGGDDGSALDALSVKRVDAGAGWSRYDPELVGELVQERRVEVL